MKLFQPELPSGKRLNILVDADNKHNAIKKATLWLKNQDSRIKDFFIGLDEELPWIVDAIEMKFDNNGVIVI